MTYTADPFAHVVIKQLARERAKISWHTHQNKEREPEASDWPTDLILTTYEKSVFLSTWRQTLGQLSEVYDTFVAYAQEVDPSLVNSPKFEEEVVLRVLSDIRAKLGPAGQACRLYREPAKDFRWEERRPPSQIIGGNIHAYEDALRLREKIYFDVVNLVPAPGGLSVRVGPIARVEETGDEPFTAILITCESAISKPTVMAIPAEHFV